MLTHAILNLMVNAAQASIKNKRDRIELSSSIIDRHWHLIVKDYGNGFDEKTMDILGQGVVHSDSGMGMALLLSNSTIERLHGNLLLVNRSDGASTKIILPIVENI